jgi:hypothetical protein
MKEAIDWARKNNHRLLFPACGISMTRKHRITGAPRSRNGTGFLSGRSFVAT